MDNSLIKRLDAIDALCNDYCGGHQDCKYYPNCENLKSIEQLPSVQSEQKKGKWERAYLDHVASGERSSIFYCSSCNQCVPFPTNFCPACGSDNRQS